MRKVYYYRAISFALVEGICCAGGGVVVPGEFLGGDKEDGVRRRRCFTHPPRSHFINSIERSDSLNERASLGTGRDRRPRLSTNKVVGSNIVRTGKGEKKTIPID